MNILLGTHGVGKTTLLEAIRATRPNFFTTDGFSRPIKQVKNKKLINSITEQVIINELTKWAFLNYVQHKNVISSRSPLDAYVYSKLFSPLLDVKDQLDIFQQNIDKVENVFYIPIEFNIVDDGVRFLDIEIQKQVDTEIRNLFSLIPTEKLHVLTGAVEERLSQFNSLI